MYKTKKTESENCLYVFKLQQLMDDKRISASKLAKATGTDIKSIHRLREGNLQKIDLDVVARICLFFCCSLTDIIDLEFAR